MHKSPESLERVNRAVVATHQEMVIRQHQVEVVTDLERVRVATRPARVEAAIHPGEVLHRVQAVEVGLIPAMPCAYPP